MPRGIPKRPRAADLEIDQRAVDRIRSAALTEATLGELLDELVRRRGTFAAVAEAQKLVLRKSADYNQAGGAGADPATADRDDYFPFGAMSYAQMIHVKAQRLNSLVLKAATSGGEPNFEGIRDTLLDLINYSSFWAERIDREARTAAALASVSADRRG